MINPDDNEIVITGKKFCCPHCKKEINWVQEAIWSYMISYKLQYMNEIRISSIRQNLPIAEMIANIQKTAYAMQEGQRELDEKHSKNTPDKKITAIIIPLKKIPAISVPEIKRR